MSLSEEERQLARTALKRIGQSGRNPGPALPERRTGRRAAWVLTAGLILAGTGAGAYRLGTAQQDGGLVQHAVETPPALPAPPARPASTIRSVIESSGFIVATRQATVSADVTGRLVAIAVSEGDLVRKGQVIATLDSRIPEANLAVAQARLEVAERSAEVTRVRLEASRTTLARQVELAGRGVISSRQYDDARFENDSLAAQYAAQLSEVEAARKNLLLQEQHLESMTIRAPFDGVVTELSANVGEIVSPISAGGGFTRTGICTIIDTAAMEGEVNISEQYLASIRGGQPVSVRLPSFPDLRLDGRIRVITSSVNRSTAAVKVRIAFDSPLPAEVLPGLRIDAAIKTGSDMASSQ